MRLGRILSLGFPRFDFFDLAVDGIVNFLSMDWHLGRCLNAQANLVTTHFHDRHHDAVPDDDTLSLFSREYQNGAPPC